MSLGIVAATGLAGCTLLYPRFDSILNPDIAFLNAGEVVGSVKCAVQTFFLDHRADIETDARIALDKQLDEQGPVDGAPFCPVGAHWTDVKKDPKVWRLTLVTRPRSNPMEGCRADPSLLLQANADKTVTIIEHGTVRETIRADTEKLLARKLIDHPRIGRRLLSAAGSGCEPFYHVYKFIRFEELKNDVNYRGRCIPNGGCKPGTYWQESGKCSLDDIGRQLVIDPDSLAKIEIGLSAVNTGSMSYQRIDATRLDILGGILVPGGVGGAVFPSLKATDKKTNKVDITLQMPQGRVQEEKREGFIRFLANAVEYARYLRPTQPEPDPQFRYLERKKKTREEVRAEVREVLAEDSGEYNEKCGALKVDYLGLAKYIKRIVADQEARIYKGPPEVSLDNFVLTSQFQISFDASAGTQNLLRIVPVMQPPTLQINPDHTHTLKITLKGNKGRKTKSRALSLVRKCLSRLENAVGSAEAATFCNRPDAILIKSLIGAVEDNASASSN